MIPELNRIYQGDCWKKLDSFDSDFFDAVVCDPPYELGFMGKSWDSTGIAYNVRMWSEVRRVMKPGAHLLAFGGTRTYHRMACAIEDADFEIRDQIQWIYGSGFPKSLDVSKAIDKAAGAERKVVGERKRNGGPAGMTEDKGWHSGPMAHDDSKVRITEATTEAAKQWEGWGTALKPANEPVCLARKPLSEPTVAANVLKWGTGALNIDGCRVPLDGEKKTSGGCAGKTALHEGGISDRVAEDNTKGRWPANVIHDGSEEVLNGFPYAPGQYGKAKTDGTPKNNKIFGAMKHGTLNPVPREDATKSAARFFYCAKTSRAERNAGCESMEGKKVSRMNTQNGSEEKGESWSPIDERTGKTRDRFASVQENNHPTVKPISLMAYLVRLVTPPRGIVLDPFLGSGSTAIAAIREGHPWVGIELIESHVAIAQARIDAECKQIKLF